MNVNPASLLHIYVNGERISDAANIGYIHINATGVTQGTARDLGLALERGIVAGVVFVDLNNGDKAALVTDLEAFGNACTDDPQYMQEMMTIVNNSQREAASRAARERFSDDSPGSRILRALTDPMVSAEEFEQVMAQERSAMTELDLAALPDLDALDDSEDTCDCVACQIRRSLGG